MILQIKKILFTYCKINFSNSILHVLVFFCYTYNWNNFSKIIPGRTLFKLTHFLNLKNSQFMNNCKEPKEKSSSLNLDVPDSFKLPWTSSEENVLYITFWISSKALNTNVILDNYRSILLHKEAWRQRISQIFVRSLQSMVSNFEW